MTTDAPQPPAVSPTRPALLSAHDASLGVPGAVLGRGLTFETTGDRLFVCGDVGALASALMRIPSDAAHASMFASLGELVPVVGPPTVVSGSLSIAGHPIASRAHLASVGAAPLDLPRPTKATVGSVLDDELRVKLALRGEKLSKDERDARADDAMRRAGVVATKGRAVRLLSLPERRVLAIAVAMVSRPAVVVAEGPLSNLEGQGAEYVRGALEAAGHMSRLIVTGAVLSPSSPEGSFARTCSDLLLLSREDLVTFGRPHEVLAHARTYRVHARTRGAELRAHLEAAGATVVGGATHFTVGFSGDEDATSVLRAAHEVRSAVALVLPLM